MEITKGYYKNKKPSFDVFEVVGISEINFNGKTKTIITYDKYSRAKDLSVYDKVDTISITSSNFKINFIEACTKCAGMGVRVAGFVDYSTKKGKPLWDNRRYCDGTGVKQ